MDALALRGEEGRDKLRKFAGIGKYEPIRKYPNGATHPDVYRDTICKYGANPGNWNI